MKPETVRVGYYDLIEIEYLGNNRYCITASPEQSIYPTRRELEQIVEMLERFLGV